MFHVDEIFDVMMETNIMGVKHVENWLHDFKFDHIKYIVVGVKSNDYRKHKYFKRSCE
jgi:hypothetical protein